ncbi:hypothetical protein MKX03_000331 [Papaver bracteatum]|nr:hypothetical protein MKX03_000331 [Papaver bracteatum]
MDNNGLLLKEGLLPRILKAFYKDMSMSMLYAMVAKVLILRCEQCGSGRSVAPIKAGFVARDGRRKDGT